MGAKILIIDDDVDIVEGEKILLEGNGYTVFTAFDGEEGLRKIREQAPDLVILDVIMASPTEGFELTRQIKRDERLASIPILMVTSVRRDDETRRHLVERHPPPRGRLHRKARQARADPPIGEERARAEGGQTGGKITP